MGQLAFVDSFAVIGHFKSDLVSFLTKSNLNTFVCSRMPQRVVNKIVDSAFQESCIPLYCASFFYILYDHVSFLVHQRLKLIHNFPYQCGEIKLREFPVSAIFLQACVFEDLIHKRRQSVCLFYDDPGVRVSLLFVLCVVSILSVTQHI